MSYYNKNLIIEKIIFQLPKKYYDDYIEWLSIGYFIFNELGSDGFTLFDKWSQQSSKYHPQSIKETYYNYNLYLNKNLIHIYNIDNLHSLNIKNETK